MTPAEQRIFDAIAAAPAGLTAADLVPVLYADGRRQPATAIDCARGAVSRVRRKLPADLRIGCFLGQYRLDRGEP